MAFNVEKVTAELIEWVRDWFENNGKGCKAVLGISGGKDSSVAAAVCVKALGKENVFGVLMPKGVQHDIDVAESLCETLGIEHITVNIENAYNALQGEITDKLGELTPQSAQNLPPRIRMTTLYAVSQTLNGRVVNTCIF